MKKKAQKSKSSKKSTEKEEGYARKRMPNFDDDDKITEDPESEGDTDAFQDDRDEAPPSRDND